MNLLICPAHYLYSNKYGSEPLWAYSLTKHLASKVSKLDAIVGVIDISGDIPTGVSLHPIFKSRSPNVFTEFFRRILFYPLVFLKYLELSKEVKYDVVHHMFPLSIATFNPSIIFRKHKSQINILGPLQLPQTDTNNSDLGVVLTGKSSGSVSSFVITLFYKLIIPILKVPVSKMFKSADLVICNSNSSLGHYKNIYKMEKSISIPTGIDVIPSPKKIYPHGKNIKLLNVGQLSERKGQIYLLEIFNKLSKQFPELTLTLIGDGPEKNKYGKYISDNNLSDNVRLLGWVSREEIEDYYLNHDIFCLTSLSDPSPTVVLEAMMYGLPVVAFDVGSVKEMIGNDDLVVKLYDNDGFVKILENFLKNTNMVEELGEESKNRVSEKYSWDKIASNYIKEYKLLIKNEV